ncbi:hypothetical protein KFV02_11065 [Desulfohalobiaceae bacterium Ax17]|uniref:hypothetical protein n=1 Tax=Desulfovulcanus ferrireducens TaxID=2831190 RepID=UPI00207BB7F0|nr:hypothetical protein [Desulfovulcanus ferrireducens]MBT8764474.1 hypothetical protein [Desulfovulcanus ferrireducens]
MPLVFVLNGYFRSGSTLLYKIIKLSNKEKAVFYEPLHNDLFFYLGNHKIGLVDRVHSTCLWDEYLLHGENFIDKLREEHPCINQIFPLNSKQVIDYIDIFHGLRAQVVLQPNRMHFVLEKVANYYSIPCVHIIRNPLDTYLDIINTYRKKRSKAIVFIADILRKFNLLPLKKAFAMDKGLEFIFKYFGKPSKWEDIIFKMRHWNDTFGIFLVNWTICNYIAIKQLEKCKGNLVIYEQLVNDPLGSFSYLEKISGLKFKKNFANMISKKFVGQYNQFLIKKMEKKIKEFQIEPEWNYVIESSGYRF